MHGLPAEREAHGDAEPCAHEPTIVASKRSIAHRFHTALRGPRNFLGGLVSHASGDPFFYRLSRHRVEFEGLLGGLEDPAAQRAFLATLRSASNVGGQAVSALDRISAARFPVLVVWGRQDRVFPVEHALRTATILPEARVVILDECGHFPSWSSPGRSRRRCSIGWAPRGPCAPTDRARCRDRHRPGDRGLRRALNERGCRLGNGVVAR